MNLEDKNVVVTGGATGIGLGIATAIAKKGGHVAIGSRTESAVADAVAGISAGISESAGLPDSPIGADSVATSDSTSKKGSAIGHTLDVSDRASVDTFFAWAESQLGPIDVLVQAAGINVVNRRMTDMDPDDWDRILKINASGAYYCMHSVIPQMRQRGEGSIINISSVAGKRALEIAGVAYSASKFAMTALGTAVSNELAGEGIRITNVYPGEVNTPILDRRPVAVSDEHRAEILQPSDIADMVVAILSLPQQAHVPEMVIKPLKQQWT